MWMPGSLSFLQRCRLARSGRNLGGLFDGSTGEEPSSVFLEAIHDLHHVYVYDLYII